MEDCWDKVTQRYHDLFLYLCFLGKLLNEVGFFHKKRLGVEKQKPSSFGDLFSYALFFMQGLCIRKFLK